MLHSCSLDYTVSSKSGILRESQLTTHQPLPRSSSAQKNVSREVQLPLLGANLTFLGCCRVCLIWKMRVCSSELWSELPGQFLESQKAGDILPSLEKRTLSLGSYRMFSLGHYKHHHFLFPLNSQNLLPPPQGSG